jgi:hypothetical protein
MINRRFDDRAFLPCLTAVDLKRSIASKRLALAEAGKRGELREYGKIANMPAALRTLAAKLASHGWRLRFCYEAGPCGYGIQRQLSEAGQIFAPAA